MPRLAAVARVQVAQRLHALQVFAGIGQVLELELTAHAGRQHGLGTGGEVAPDHVQQRLGARAGGLFRRGRHGTRQVDGRGLGGRLGGGVEAQREGAQAGVHAQAGAAHGGLEIIAREGQAPLPATAPNRLALMTLPARSARSCRSKHMKRLAAARPASSTLFGSAMPLPGADFADRVAAVRGRDQHAAVGRDQAALDGAAAFHQFGRHHQVHVARRGHQRQRARGAFDVGLGQQFQVIDGGAGALGHARHRGGLRPPAGVLGHVDDPVGEHAAPWPPMARTAILIGEAARGAAEVLMLLSMSEPQSASCARRARARCRKPITARARGPEPVAAGGVVDDVGAIERGAQHGGMGHFTAVAAAHAAAFHVRDRVFL